MKLSDYTNAIEQRLLAAQAAGDPALRPGDDCAGIIVPDISIVVDDIAELETEIKKAVDEKGLIILIGQPWFDNSGQALNGPANMRMKSQIAIGENVTLWRRDGHPKSQDVAKRVMDLLQGFKMSGFSKLRVGNGHHEPDKKRQLWQLELESNFTVQETT